MSYLDTCVIIDYGFKEEENHTSAEKIVEEAKTRRFLCFNFLFSRIILRYIKKTSKYAVEKTKKTFEKKQK